MSSHLRRSTMWLSHLFGKRPAKANRVKPPRTQAFVKPGIDPLEDRIVMDVALTSIPTWVEQGPTVVNGAVNVSVTQPDAPIVGPIQAILTHPTDPNITYASSPGGGLWKSALTGGQVNWTHISAELPTQNVTSLAFSPTDSQIIYAGTGEMRIRLGNFSDGVAYHGIGVIKSIDGGLTWTVSPLEDQYKFANGEVRAIAPLTFLDPTTNKQVVLAGQDRFDGRGLLRSSDGGRTWAVISGNGSSGLPLGDVLDIIMDPVENQTAYAAVNGNLSDRTGQGVYRTRDAGVTWQLIDSTFMSGLTAAQKASISDIRLAMAKTANSPLYVAIMSHVGVDSDGFLATQLTGLWRTGQMRTANAGAIAWDTLPLPSSGELDNVDNNGDGSIDEQGERIGLHGRGKGNLGFSMAVLPSDPQILFMGGDQQPSVGITEANLGENLGRIWGFGVAQANTWTQVTGATLANFSGTGAFSHAMAFTSAGNLLQGDETGLYRLDSPVAATRKWSFVDGPRVNRTTSVAYDPIGNRAIIGSDGGGSAYQTLKGNDGVDNNGLGGVDDIREKGAFQSVNTFELNAGPKVAVPLASETLIYSLDTFGHFIDRLHMKAGVEFVQGNDDEFATLGNLKGADKKMVVDGLTPLAVNTVDSTKVLLGGEKLYQGQFPTIGPGENSGSIQLQVVKLPGSTDTIRAIVYGGREPNPNATGTFINRENVTYVATDKQIFIRGATGDFTEVAGIQDLNLFGIRQIVVDPDDWRTAYVRDLTGTIIRLTGAGANREILSRPYGSMPDYTIWSMELAKAVDGTHVLFVGTDGGVWRTINPSATSEWFQFGRGMPTVSVIDLHYDRTDDILLAGTYGRGVWTVSGVKNIAGIVPALNITGTSTNDTVRINVDPINPYLLDVQLNTTAPVKVPLRSFRTISVATLAGADTFYLDLSQGSVPAPGGIAYDAGIDSAADIFEIDDGSREFEAKQSGPISVNGTQVSVKGEYAETVVTVQNVSTAIGNLAAPHDSQVARLVPGLNRLADAFPAITNIGLNQDLPIIGATLDGAINGLQGNVTIPGQTSAFTPVQSPNSGLFRRLVETGTGAFPFSSIGVTINTLPALQYALDGLDDIPNNVSLDFIDGVVRFDVHILKTLGGLAELDTSVLNGLVQVGGIADISTLIDFHLIFGLDSGGFYIDAEGNSEPEITISSLQGAAVGDGKVGFLGVGVGAEFAFNPNVKIQLDLTDPGTGTSDDGFIRLVDLLTVNSNLVSSSLDAGLANGVPDVTMNATFNVSALNFDLIKDAKIGITWNDVTDRGSATLSAQTSNDNTDKPARRLLRWLTGNSSQILSGLHDLANVIEQSTGAEILNKKIPLLNKTIGELLDSAPDDFALPNSEINTLTPVKTVDVTSSFEVFVDSTTNLLENGIVANNIVKYQSVSGPATAIIDKVEKNSFTVVFAASDNFAPSTNPNNPPNFKLVRPGKLESMLNSFHDGVDVDIPTFQELLQELGDRTGLDFLSNTTVTGDVDDLSVVMPFTFDPKAFKYTTRLDLSSSIPGLSVGASGDFNVTIDPKFQFKVGIRLAPELDFAQRVFIINDTAPEVTLDLHAQFDNPVVTGALGILDVRLTEAGNPATNKGVKLDGLIGLNLTKTGIPSGQLTLADLATSTIDPTLDARLDIDGLQISADVGSANLGTIAIELEGETKTDGNGIPIPEPGHVHSFAELGGLPSVLATHIVGQSNFSNYNNITPQMALELLNQIVLRLTEMGKGDVLQKRIPIINKSIAELVDLGAKFAEKIYAVPAPTDNQTLTLKALQTLINSKLQNANVTLSARPGEVLIGFSFNPGFSKTIPINFDFDNGNKGFSPTVSGEGMVTINGQVSSNITVALKTGKDIEFADRVSFVTFDPVLGPLSRFNVTGTLNAGYDLNNNGTFEAATEGSPVGIQVGVGPIVLALDKGRALITLDTTVQLKDGVNNDDRLSFKELANEPIGETIGGTFDGTAQAILPLDGNTGDGIAVNNDPAQLTNTANARITIAGKLSNLGNLVFNNVNDQPIYHIAAGPSATSSVDISDKLTDAELDPAGRTGKFRIFVHNLDGLIANGVLSYKNIIAGFEKFLAWGQSLLGIDVLDFKLPIIGKSVKEQLDSFGTGSGSVGQFLSQFQNSTVAFGDTLESKGIRAAVNAMAGAIKNNIAGVTVIGDANEDGRVDDTMTNGKLDKVDDLVRFTRGVKLPGAVQGTQSTSTVTSSADTFTLTANNGFDWGVNLVAKGDRVTYFGADGILYVGTVAVVDAATPTVVVITKSDPSKNPDLSRGTINIEVREIIGATFLVKFAPHIDRTVPLDLGLKFLNFKANVNLNFSADLNFRLGFGLNKTDGFFIKTDFSDVLVRNTANPNGPLVAAPIEAELQATGGATVAAAPGSVGFSLGFLDFKTNGVLDPTKNFFNFTLGLDLLSPSGTGKLKINDLLNLGAIKSFVMPKLLVQAGLDIPLTIDTALNDKLPSIDGRFVLNWAKRNADGTFPLTPQGLLQPFDVTQGIPKPKIQIRDVSLDAGSILSKAAQPFFQKLNQYNPLGPIIDFFSEPLPLLNKSLYQILIVENPTITEDTRKTAQFLFTLATVINETATNAASGAGLKINFGSLEITEQNVPGTAGQGNQIAGGTQAGAAPTDGADETGDNDNGPGKDPAIPGSGLPNPLGDFFKKLGKIGITFPVLKFSNVGKLLTGGNVDLIFISPPKLEIGKQFNINFPLFSFGIPYVADVNISAFFGGGFSFFLNLSAGFDTRGIRLHKEDPANHSVIEGFYIGDFDPNTNKDGSPDSNGIIDPDDKERPEIGLEAFVQAGIDAKVRLVGLPLGQATGTAGIKGTVGIDLNDDDEDPTTHQPIGGDDRSSADRHDGRLYLDEIPKILDATGTEFLGLFDLVGQLDAFLKIELSVIGIFHASYEFNWLLKKFELTFTNDLPDDGAHFGQLFANGGSNKKLVLTSDTSDEQKFRRGRAATNHPGGDNVQVILVDKDKDPNTGVTTLTFNDASAVVTRDGSDPHLITITKAGFGFAEKGIAVGQRVAYNVRINNVATPKAGTVTAVDADSVTIMQDDPASAATEVLQGAGNYKFNSGRETLRLRKLGIEEDYGPLEKNENGTNKPNFISDINLINLLTDSGGAGERFEMSNLGVGNDTITVDPLFSGQVILHGGAGDDNLIGARGNDLLMGNDGNDNLDGGQAPDGVSGNDTIIGGGGNDQINGRGGNDILVGDFNDAAASDPAREPLPLSSVSDNAKREGNDTIAGGDGNDTIWGDNKGTSLAADGPQPSVPTSPTANLGFTFPIGLPFPAFTVRSSDTITGGAGSDTAFGGTGNDNIRGDEPDDAGGADVLRGGSGNDKLLGFAGNDTLIGDEGTDILIGGAGDDQLFAGDTIFTTTIPTGGKERLYGDEENTNTTAAGSNGHDSLDGTDAGQLLAKGGPGNDIIVGSTGDDQLYGNDGADAIIGGPGNDLVDGGVGNDDLVGGRGGVSRFSNFNIGQQTGTLQTFGYAGFLPTGFSVTERRGDGADTIITGQDGDVVDSGNGTILSNRTVSLNDVEVVGLSDTLNLSRLPNSVDYNLDSQTNILLAQTDSVFVARRMESFVGTSFNDTLHVDALTTARSVNGGAGFDTLEIDAKNNPLTITKGAITPFGLQPVTITNFETVTLSNVTDFVEFFGDDLDNTLTLKQTNGIVTYQWDNGPIIPLGTSVNFLNALLGKGNDTLVIDLSGGDFLVNRTINFGGGEGAGDKMRLIGNGTQNVLYRQSFDSDAAGLLLTNQQGGQITFNNVEDSIELTNAASAELELNSDRFSIVFGATQKVGSTTFAKLTATNSHTITPLVFAKVANATIDLTFRDSTSDFADTVALFNTINSDITGLSQLTVNLGDGNDVMQADGFGSDLTVQGGAGIDSVSVTLNGHRLTALDALETNNLTVLASNNSSTLSGNWKLGGSTIAVNNGAAIDDLIVNAQLTGLGDFTKTGSGTLRIDGAVTFTGETIVNGGVLKLGTGNRLPSASAVTIAAGAMLDLNGFSDTIGAVTTAGNVHLGAGATLTVAGPYIQSDGTTDLDGGTMTIQGTGNAVSIREGTLNGPGTINGKLNNFGDVQPGGADGKPGSLNVNGDYVQGSSALSNLFGPGTFRTRIFAAGQGFVADSMSVAGVATLAGALDVQRPPTINQPSGANPTNGIILTPMTFASRSGDFATKDGLALPPSGTTARSLDPTFTTTAFRLTAQNGAAVRGTGGSTGAPEGGLLTFQVQVDNPDNHPLVFSLEPGAPPTASVNPSTGLVTWPPKDGAAIVPIYVRVTDQVTGLSDTVLVECTVIGVSPTILAGGDGVVAPGGTFHRVGSISDPGPDVFTATVNFGDGTGAQQLPVDATDHFTLDHVYALPGVYTVTINVADDDGQSSVQSFPVRVTFDIHARNRHYVQDLYRDLLQREGDEGGIAGWTQLADAGFDRGAIASSILASAEYRAHLVQRAFQEILGREAEPGALNFYLNQLGQGTSEAQLRAIIFGSNEYFQKSGGTVDAFLIAVYRDVLHRPIDSEGQVNFASAIGRGLSRETAALAILNSVEAREQKVVSWFDTHFKRSADAGGLAYFLTFLNAGKTDESVLAMLLASPEYFQKT